jgi:hypothetical protein
LRLGRVCKLYPEQDRHQGQHCHVVGRALFVARSDAPKLLQAVDRAFDAVAFPLHCVGEVPCAPFTRLARHRYVHPAWLVNRMYLAACLPYLRIHNGAEFL